MYIGYNLNISIVQIHQYVVYTATVQQTVKTCRYISMIYQTMLYTIKTPSRFQSIITKQVQSDIFYNSDLNSIFELMSQWEGVKPRMQKAKYTLYVFYLDKIFISTNDSMIFIVNRILSVRQTIQIYKHHESSAV